MTVPHIILIGGSAGSFSLIVDLLRQIPPDFIIPIVIVIHRNEKYESKIEGYLDQLSSLKVKVAEDKEKISAGSIYFAPAGYHLLVEPNYSFSLDISPAVNFCRPSIDLTFETAAEAYTINCCGIILSGANQDGAEGLRKIFHAGGRTMVQDPAEAEIATMPASTLKKCPGHAIYSYQQIKDSIRNMQQLNPSS